MSTPQPVSQPPRSEEKEPKQEPWLVRAFEYRNQLIVASQFVLSRIGSAPIGIVLGSGLGGFGEKLQDVKELPYSDIPFLPQPTVKGHSGKIMMGTLKSKDGKTSKRIMCFSGRLHPYEGYPMFQVTFCARLAYLCGVHTMILTNAAGGCIPKQLPGSVVIVKDYVRDVYFTVLNHSANDCMFGVRHMKCDKLLDEEITNLFVRKAKECKFPYYTGCYWWCTGPTYETASQIRYSIKAGAQCVGMSTVPSILAAKSIGLRVAVLSLCTNVAAGLADEELNHNVVVANAKAASVEFGNFVEQSLLEIADPTDYFAPAQVKLNLTRLDTRIDIASFDEFIFPRACLAKYDELYRDIIHLRSFLSNVLDLSLAEVDEHGRSGKPGTFSFPNSPGMIDFVDDIVPDLPLLGQGDQASVSAPHLHQFEQDIGTPIDFADFVPDKSRPENDADAVIEDYVGDGLPDEKPLIRTASSTGNYGNDYASNWITDRLEKIKNRDGPIPVWILHDPFTFDSTTLQAPIAVPVKTLSGFNSVSTSASARNAILNFGLDSHYNLVVVIVGLALEGFSFDECNYIINLLYGIIGHKNMYFTNMFYAFPTRTMYSDGQTEEKEWESITRGQYALIKDSVDFKGGFPRFPFPLFPPKETNTSDCFVRMKFGVFDNTKTTDSAVECLKGFKGFFDGLNRGKNTNVYSYAYWAGPHWPTMAELKLSELAGCEITGISSPSMTPMSRQLGCDGYSVAYIGTQRDFDRICESRGIKTDVSQNVTSLVFAISSSIITFFKSSRMLFSPASMNRNHPHVFQASLITDARLQSGLANVQVPHNIPQYQLLRGVDDEWTAINAASQWLSSVWNFSAVPIVNALFSSFSHDRTSRRQQILMNKLSKRALISIDLSQMPGWNEHFCGGYQYSHYHWNNANPFEWTLKIYRYDISKEFIVEAPTYYIVVEPYFFTNIRLHPQRYAYMTSFYKYTPRFWNLSFLLRVLWKVGVKNVCFLTHLLGNNCEKSKRSTLDKNTVVMLNNYVECSKWNILCGPNDDRMGPRFTPITEPIDLEEDFKKVVGTFAKKIPSVITVHVPSSATISQTTSLFYGGLGYQTRVLGLVPCIQTAQHLGLKKLCVGITDYHVEEKLQNVESFDEVIKMIEMLFGRLEPNKRKKGTTRMQLLSRPSLNYVL